MYLKQGCGLSESARTISGAYRSSVSSAALSICAHESAARPVFEVGTGEMNLFFDFVRCALVRGDFGEGASDGVVVCRLRLGLVY